MSRMAQLLLDLMNTALEYLERAQPVLKERLCLCSYHEGRSRIEYFANNDRIGLVYKAAISAITAAGNYSHEVYYTLTGKF